MCVALVLLILLAYGEMMIDDDDDDDDDDFPVTRQQLKSNTLLSDIDLYS